MIAQMTPDQISVNWSLISEHLEKSLPPVVKGTEIRMNNILDALMSGRMQMWAVTDESDNILIVCVTVVMIDPGTFCRNLLIYALVRIKSSTYDAFHNGVEVLRKFAEAQGCRYINAYACEESVVSLARKLGADTNWTYISFEVS